MSGLSERIRVFEQIRSKDEHRLPTEFTKLGSIVGFEMANQIASTVESCILESTKRPTAAEILHEEASTLTRLVTSKLIAELREKHACTGWWQLKNSDRKIKANSAVAIIM